MAERPNIVLLFTDQQRYDCVGVSGNRKIRTPNLDRLAAGGRYYSMAHTPNPVCIPARHCLLTGERSKVHGYYHNAGHPMPHHIPTLMQLLSDSGYWTQGIGKMHFRPRRRNHGYDRFLSMEEIPDFREQDEYLMYLKSVGQEKIRHPHGVRHLLYQQPQRSIIPEEHHGTRWVGDRSVEFLRMIKGKWKPFFLWSSWIAPHPPFNCCDRWAEQYNASDMDAPNRREGEVISERLRMVEFLGDYGKASEERFLRTKALYYAQVSFIDEQIGRILDELDHLGFADNTLVMFTSDHGELLGDHWGWQKSNPYEPVIRVPMILRWPERISPGETSDDFVDLLDALPTFLDAAGIEHPSQDSLPGGSLISSGVGSRTDRTIQFVENHAGAGRWIAARNKKHKYVYWFHNGYEEFFDLEEDPNELHNLAVEEMDEEHSRIKNEWYKLLVEFEKKYGPEEIGDSLPNFGIDHPHAMRRNAQFSTWVEAITDPEELAALNSVEDEVQAVVAKEPSVKLHELDLDFWVEHGGSKELAERARNEKL